jgi:hypothetical protein
LTDGLCRDIAVLKTYGAAPYATALKKLEKDIRDKQNSVNEKIGVKVIISAAVLHTLNLKLTRA